MIDAFIYCKIEVDKEGRPIDWIYLDNNEAHTQILGRTRDQIIGKKVSEVLPEESEDQTDWIGKYGRVALTGEPLHFEGYRQSLKKWVHTSAYSPKKGYFVAIFEDITERMKAEEALRYNELLLTGFFDSAGQMRGIVEVINGKDVRHIKDNSVTASYVGLTPKDLEGKLSSELGEPAERIKTWIDHYKQSQETGKPVVWEYTDREGSRITWLSPTVTYIGKSSQGNPRFTYVVTDITERKKAEETIKQNEEKYRQLFSSMTEMFQVIELIYDEDGNPIDYYYREVNPAFEKLVGKTREQLVDKRVKAVFGIVEDYWLEAYSKVAKTGSPCHFENYGAELDKWYDVYVWKANDKQVAITFTNISERKETEVKTQKLQEAVQQERDRLASLVNSMNDEVWFADTEKKFTLANPAAIKEFKIDSSGETVDAVNLAATAEIYRSDGSPRPVEESPALRGLKGETLKNEIEIVRTPASGELRYRQVSAAPVRNTGGKIIGSVSVVRDITELKQLQNRLQKYNDDLQKLVEERTKQLKDSERLAAIGATAGMVGHDIRNPLQAITGDVFLAKSELEVLDESENKRNALESLNEIEGNIDYINKIVADLQDYARPLNPRAQESNIQSIVNETISKMKLSKDLRVKVNIKEDAEKIMADPDYIKRIISNLVLNAVQAMPEGGKLTVNANKDGKSGEIVFEVQDTGVGIADDVKDKLFTPMFTTKSKGQGFGLAVVKRMTETLGGTVTFESEHGRGTKFIVRLPPPKELNGKWIYK